MDFTILILCYVFYSAEYAHIAARGEDSSLGGLCDVARNISCTPRKGDRRLAPTDHNARPVLSSDIGGIGQGGDWDKRS